MRPTTSHASVLRKRSRVYSNSAHGERWFVVKSDCRLLPLWPSDARDRRPLAWLVANAHTHTPCYFARRVASASLGRVKTHQRVSSWVAAARHLYHTRTWPNAKCERQCRRQLFLRATRPVGRDLDKFFAFAARSEAHRPRPVITLHIERCSHQRRAPAGLPTAAHVVVHDDVSLKAICAQLSARLPLFTIARPHCAKLLSFLAQRIHVHVLVALLAHSDPSTSWPGRDDISAGSSSSPRPEAVMHYPAALTSEYNRYQPFAAHHKSSAMQAHFNNMRYSSSPHSTGLPTQPLNLNLGNHFQSGQNTYTPYTYDQPPMAHHSLAQAH